MTQEPVFKNVLLPLDGSELAEQILEPALALGTLMQAEFTLLGVVDPILEFDEDIRGRRSIAFSPSLLAEVKAARERHEAEARSYLNQVANRLRSESHRVQVRIAQNLKPAAAILNDASDQSIDLVALATQGRGGLARMFLGSVADKVVRGATTPVLVYRPRNK
jgi:nucleotide-binding universal stress UspA family protein